MKNNPNNKNILKRMYETIMKEGGPTGPISKSLVDLYEKTPPIQNKKQLLFLRKVGDKNTSRDEMRQNLIRVLKENGWKIKGGYNGDS